MKNVAQTASSILVGAASLAYLVEHGPKIYYKGVRLYYSRRVKLIQKTIKELTEDAQLRVDLEWNMTGKAVAQKYIDEHAGDDRETDPELILHNLHQMYKNFGVNRIIRNKGELYAALMQKSVPPHLREQIKEDVVRMDKSMQALKDQLEDIGFAPDQLTELFQPA